MEDFSLVFEDFPSPRALCDLNICLNESHILQGQ